MRVGVIATSSLPIPDGAECRVVPTRSGDVPYFACKDTCYIRRAGWRHPLIPTMINTPAIALALRNLQVRAVISTCVVGTLNSKLGIGSLGIVHQFLDFDKHRPTSLFAGDEDFCFTDVSEPFCISAQQAALEVSHEMPVDVVAGLCYVGVDGPRYETAAEVRMYQSFNADVVVHTSVPEAIMLRELGICHLGVVQIANYAAGVGPCLVNNEHIHNVRTARASELMTFVELAIEAMGRKENWTCACSIARGSPQVSGRRPVAR